MFLRKGFLVRKIDPKNPQDIDRLIFDINRQFDDIIVEMNRVAAAAPTAGTFRVGERVYNNSPTSGGYVGWVCTVAGTPGVWRGFGLIA